MPAVIFRKWEEWKEL